jgi:hypothetical protein
MLLLQASLAAAYVYFTREAIVQEYFPGQVVDTVRWTPDAGELAWLREQLGYASFRPSYDIVVGAGAWAVFDEQLGQHEPISLATLVDARFAVARVEVMVYREAYGDGVRAPAFRQQFEGLDLASRMRPGREIRIVSGATISTRALSIAVRRACALVEAFAS